MSLAHGSHLVERDEGSANLRRGCFGLDEQTGFSGTELLVEYEQKNFILGREVYTSTQAPVTARCQVGSEGPGPLITYHTIPGKDASDNETYDERIRSTTGISH